MKEGAALCATKTNITLENSTFVGNEARFGGAIYACSILGISISHSSFIGNMGEENGGAIYMEESNDGALSNCNFSENLSLKGGGLLLKRSNRIAISNCNFIGNKYPSDESFTTSPNKNGGAIHLVTSNYGKISNCNFTNNTASWNGGALSFEMSRNGTVSNCNFVRNKASKDGGAMGARSNSSVLLIESIFSNNEAKENGTIKLSNSNLTLDSVALYSNNAEFGGAIFGKSAIINITNSILETNYVRKSGGVLYMERSEATIEDTRMHSNEAQEDCGGICVYRSSSLNAKNLSVCSSSAGNVGGGIAVDNGSSILCYSCMILNNTADRGAGLHVYSDNSKSIVAQLQNSQFENNSAHLYGGGMEFNAPLNTAINCSSSRVDCASVVLLNTNFVGNFANLSGGAILTTQATKIWFDCENRERIKDFIDEKLIRLLHSIHPQDLCPSWTRNRISRNASGAVVGTFGQKFKLSIATNSDVKLGGNPETGYVLKNVSSGKQLPQINVTVLDEFGEGLAPTIPRTFEVRLSALDGFFSGLYPVNISDGFGNFSNVAGFAKPRKYALTLEGKSDDPAIKELNVMVMVRKCHVGEERTRDGLTCQVCDAFSYNFYTSKNGKCKECPNDATCRQRYIVPKRGYWHKYPCRKIIQKCLVKEACSYDKRDEKLREVTSNFTQCKFDEMEKGAYNDLLCNEGYEGPLCGSCAKSYAPSRSFECTKCGLFILSLLEIAALVCYLLVGTSLTIKGILPLSSSQQTREEEETPILEANTHLMESASNDQTRTQNEGSSGPTQVEIELEEPTSTNTIHQERVKVETIKQNLTETFKVLLNFFQVISLAMTMDVKWTHGILKLLQKLQVLGAATVSSISTPISCLFSSNSNATRDIWKTLFSILTPIIVIAILALYWGYRAIKLHKGERLYFVKRLILTIVIVTYITYFDLTLVAVRVFNCVNVHNSVDDPSDDLSDDLSDDPSDATTSYWIADMSIECYKDNHFILIGIALVVIALVSISFPLFCSVSLFTNRDEALTPRSWTRETLGFLCGPFKQRFIYWECITMIKKALLSIIIVFSYSLGNHVQGLLILLVLVIFLYTHFACFPYHKKYNTLNYYESISLLVSCITYTLIQFFNIPNCSEVIRTIVSVALIAINSGFVCLMVYKMIKELIHLVRSFLRSKNIRIHESMNLLNLVKTYYKNRKSFSHSN